MEINLWIFCCCCSSYYYKLSEDFWEFVEFKNILRLRFLVVKSMIVPHDVSKYVNFPITDFNVRTMKT